MKYNSHKDGRQMQWCPLLIRFALNLKYCSTSAYCAILECEQRLIFLTSGYLAIMYGPEAKLLQHIKRTIALDEMNMPEKHFVLSMEEMKI